MEKESAKKMFLKLPWEGFSLNLIEYFCIVGLELNEILQYYFQNNKYEFNPDVISSIISNPQKMLNNDQIVKLIYPKRLTLISSNSPPQTSSHVISINADSYENKKQKIPFFGTCFLFHESLSKYFKNDDENIKSLFKEKEKEISNIYVPKAFCIISQFPHFSFFNSLNKEFYEMFQKGNEIPMEVMIYSIVNMIPSPLNYSIDFILQNKTFLIPQLSGYPIIDFDLFEIFNVLGINYVVELYLLFLLDIDMIFFSNNLELLNFTMYILSELSYPCNDSFHNWYCLSISLDDFNDPECMYATRPFAMIIGINEKYNNNNIKMDTSRVKKAFHVVVDLDDKKMYPKNNSSKEEDNNIIYDFITKIKNLKQTELSVLSKNIKSLVSDIDSIRPYNGNSKDSNSRMSKPSSKQNLNQINVNVNFFETKNEIRLKNKQIQSHFYNFNLKLYSFYSKFFSIESIDPKLKLVIDYQFNSTNLPKEEIIFSNTFINSQKFKSFTENYVKFNDSLDSYRIPYLFFEEFLYLQKGLEKGLEDKKDLENVFQGFLNIIDKFYSNNEKIEIKSEKIKDYYSKNKNFLNKNLKDKISYFLDQSPDTLSFEYSICKLDNNILFNYIYSTNQNNEIFNLRNKNELLIFNYNDVSNLIEKTLISTTKLLRHENFIVLSLVMIFILTRKGNHNDMIKDTSNIKSIVTKNFIIFRKYIFELFNELLINPSDSKHLVYSNLRSQLRMFFPFQNLMNLLNSNNPYSNFENIESSSPNLLDINSESLVKEYKVHLTNNFCCGIFRNPEYFMKEAEYCYLDRNFYIDCAQCKISTKKLQIIFQFIKETHSFSSELFTPLKLFNQTKKILEEYNNYDHFYMIKPEVRNKILLNLIFYTKHLNIESNFIRYYLKQE